MLLNLVSSHLNIVLLACVEMLSVSTLSCTELSKWTSLGAVVL